MSVDLPPLVQSLNTHLNGLPGFSLDVVMVEVMWLFAPKLASHLVCKAFQPSLRVILKPLIVKVSLQ